MKHTAKLPTTMAGEKHFIVEGLTDDVISLAPNTLAAATDAWDDASGHPTARNNRVQRTGETLTPDLVDHLVNLTSPEEQHNQKGEGQKVTDWTILDKPPDAPTLTLTCHQHTWWVAQWNTPGTTDSNPTGTGDRFNQSTHHTDQPRTHWLALKTAMHWAVDAPTTDTTLPAAWLTLTGNLAGYIPKPGTSRAEGWMSWLTDSEQTLKLCTTSLQPCEGQGPTYSIFHNRNAPKLAPKPSPKQARPQPSPHPEGAGIPARRTKRPKPEPKAARVPPLPEPQPKPKPQACPFFTVAERNAMQPEWPDGAGIQGAFGATLNRPPKKIVCFRGKIQSRLATPGQHGNLKLEIEWQALPECGEKVETLNLELWDDKEFPECPVQLRTHANQVASGTVWTGDVPEAWLEELNILGEQRVATAINLKLRLGQ